MPLTDQWQGFTGLPDFSDPPPIPTDIKAQFDFLASRAIPRYASEAARDAELTSPTNGQMCWVDSLKALQIRDAAATPPWQTVWSKTGWIDIPLNTGFTALQTPQVRLKSGVVYFRGVVQRNAGAWETYETIGAIPAEMSPPTEYRASGATFASTTARGLLVRITEGDTDIQVAGEGAGANTLYLAGLSPYAID